VRQSHQGAAFPQFTMEEWYPRIECSW